MPPKQKLKLSPKPKVTKPQVTKPREENVKTNAQKAQVNTKSSKAKVKTMPSHEVKLRTSHAGSPTLPKMTKASASTAAEVVKVKKEMSPAPVDEDTDVIMTEVSSSSTPPALGAISAAHAATAKKKVCLLLYSFLLLSIC